MDIYSYYAFPHPAPKHLTTTLSKFNLKKIALRLLLALLHLFCCFIKCTSTNTIFKPFCFLSMVWLTCANLCLQPHSNSTALTSRASKQVLLSVSWTGTAFSTADSIKQLAHPEFGIDYTRHVIQTLQRR